MATKFLSKFLLPPQFLAMDPVGLDISDAAVRFVEFKKKNGGLVLGRYGEVPLPTGVVFDGEIKRPDELSAILKKIQIKYGFKFVKVSLPEQESYLFKIQVPGALNTCPNIRQNIEFRLEENIPLAPSDTVFDFEVTGHSKDGSVQDVSVSAASAKTIDSYIFVLNEAGFVPVAFEVESKAVAKALIKRQDQAPYIIINIKEKATTISVIDNGMVQVTSTANIGGTAIDEAISRQEKVTIEEAKKVKDKYLYKETKDSLEVFSALLNFISAVKDETERFYSYWLSHRGAPGRDVEKVILCGRDSLVSGFEKYLYLALKKDIEPANVWINVFSTNEQLPPLSFPDSLNYAVAIGLALPE